MNNFIEQLQSGDSTFTYSEYLLQLCEQENKYYQLYSNQTQNEIEKENKTWPTINELQTIYQLTKQYHSLSFWVHTSDLPRNETVTKDR